MNKNKLLIIIFSIIALIASPLFYFADFGHGWSQGLGLGMGISTILMILAFTFGWLKIKN